MYGAFADSIQGAVGRVEKRLCRAQSKEEVIAYNDLQINAVEASEKMKATAAK
jgi:hypothetical protein